MQAQTPRRLIAFTRSKIPAGSSAASLGGTWMPALLKAMSRRPYVATVRSTGEASWSSAGTSLPTACEGTRQRSRFGGVDEVGHRVGVRQEGDEVARRLVLREGGGKRPCAVAEADLRRRGCAAGDAVPREREGSRDGRDEREWK